MRGIDDLKAKFSREVDNFKRYTRMVFSQRPSSGAIQRYEQKKNDFYIQSQERLVEISKKILDYNLYCSVSMLGRSNFKVDDEMSQIIKDIEKITEDLGGNFYGR